MIGSLPESLNIAGKDYAICADFRIALLIFEAYEDPNLSQEEKASVMLESLFEEPFKIPVKDLGEAQKKASWFLDGGNDYSKNDEAKEKIISWTQDEQMIFSGINQTAGYEVRGAEFVHWWTFLGYLCEMGECLFTSVRSLRQKLAQGKPLDKYEEEFLQKHGDIVIIKEKLTEDERKKLDELNQWLG